MKTSWVTGIARLRPGSVARAESLLNACVRECAHHLASIGSLGGRSGGRQAALVAAVGRLVEEHTAVAPDEARTFDALLGVGTAALQAGETRLARRVAETAVALRSGSRAAWRLRGDALYALGRAREALDAYERYESLGGGDLHVVRRRGALREQWAALTAADRIVPDARLTERPPEEVREALAGAVQQRLNGRGAADPETRRLAAAYATYVRLADSGSVADPLLGGTEPVGVGPLRTELKGRSVCVVANGEAVAASGLGEEIDSYDLVVRLDSFETAPAENTGTRVDLHAVSYRCAAPAAWRRRVGIRLVFGDKPVQWRDAIRHRLVPGAQRFVGDRSLARPVRDPALIGEEWWAANPSAGFSVVRLLDFLDVNPRIDLVGLTQPGQLRPEERQWVLAHARRREAGGMRIALR